MEKTQIGLSKSICALCLLLLAQWGGADDSADSAAFISVYENFRDNGMSGEDALPFSIEAGEIDGLEQARVLALLENVSFDRFSSALINPVHWCEFIPIHQNVKSCVYDLRGESPRLRFYLGRKEYQEPCDARLLDLDFSASRSNKLLTSVLTAENGPFGTTDYNFILNAIPVDNGVFMELSISNRLGAAGSVLGLYFMTLGRNKIGFTVVENDRKGRPVYVDGRQGANERNVVRYLLAMEVFLANMKPGQDAEFLVNAGQWHDETEKYADQLHELERRVYLKAKTKEHDHQVRLQNLHNSGVAICGPDLLDRK